MRSSSAFFDAAWAIAVEFVMAMSRLALAAQINEPESTWTSRALKPTTPPQLSFPRQSP